ncbi:lysozyme-like domain-containing protein [Crepidotus variabilis]|uniref:Lysozyme-like domain-containing protein n=1 Tax=Crepidotus variabilis TaxID=179855 RepID=A0A9P6E7U8_9AGAR|nr:lysozyme-like domain-containing protein [Crepidotus variabilis]
MKLLAVSFVYFALTVLSAEASAIHGLSGIAVRHAQISKRTMPLESVIQIRDAPTKRCKNRPGKQSTVASAPSSTVKPPPAQPPVKAASPPPAAAAAPAPPPASNGGGNGLIKANDGRCGPNGATKDITPTSGPNGAMDWLDCGFEGGGWNPPFVKVQDLVTVSLSEAIQKPGNPFGACKDFIEIFERHGNANGVPPIMLASFAMQESSCQPWQIGGAGEQGLMQITKDKCGGAPGNNCLDPDFNIGAGARYFKQTLDSLGGNVIQAVGTYNGWRVGLTPATAFAGYNGNCHTQNDGDYLQKFFNGFLQSVDPSNYNGQRLGKYHNLDRCG